METFITRFVAVVVAAALGTFIGLVAFILTMALIDLF